jgi:hypothetical protein
MRSRMRVAGEGDGAFLHRFQQRRLGLGRRAVDLVGQQHLGEYGTGLEAEHALAGTGVFLQDLGADDIRGHQVGRELDAAELHVRGLGQRLHQQGLAQARHAFDQRVAAAQQAGEQQLHHVLLADDDTAHARLERVDLRHQVGDVVFSPCFCHSHFSFYAPNAY